MNDLARAFDGHDHGHHDQDGHAQQHRDDRALYALTALMGLLLAGELLFGGLGWERWRAPGGVSLALIAALIGGLRVVYGALEALVHRSIGADVALAQASVAALVIGQPFVAAEVVFIALVGEVLEALTFARAQRSIHRLLDATPQTARVRRDGEELTVAASDVRVGDTVIVLPGERVPVDGTVTVGRSTVDQSMLTGEPVPVDRGPGEPVYTGTINQFGRIDVRAEKVGRATTLGQVLKMVAESQRRKAPLERAADRLARYFLPVVQVAAGLTLLFGYLLGWPDVWFRTVAVLVVACPCALVLATPAAVLASMAWLARHGVLIKGGAALERLATCDTVAFDKTGTLTLGRPELSRVVAFDVDETEVLRLAATAEASSGHPLARAVTRAAELKGLGAYPVHSAETLPGAGVAADFRERDGGPERHVLVGNARLLTEQGLTLDGPVREALVTLDERGETSLLVAVDGRVVGLLGARDTVRPEADGVVNDLKNLGFSTIAVLTGDRESAARFVARKTHIKIVESEQFPADKARWVERAQGEGRKVAMIGDGINDAPALAAAHVGIALGGIGADLAAEAGDIVVLGEPLRVLPGLVGLSRATVRIIRQNIIGFAFGLNALAMTSAALGWLGPVPAAVLHQLGSLLVLLNSMRLLVYGGWSDTPPVRSFRTALAALGRWDDRVDPGIILEHLFTHWRAVLGTGLVTVLLVYLTWGVTAVGPSEAGLVRRFGRHVATIGPGLHVGFPPPFEILTRVEPGRVRSLEIGFRTGAVADPTGFRWESGHGRGVTARDEDGALLMTGDGQLVELAATAQYTVKPGDQPALRAFVFDVADPASALRPIAEASVREVVGRSALEGLITKGRRDAERAAADLIQKRADACRLGLKVTTVSFQDVHPPLPVVDAYRDVSRAESDRQRRVNEGKAYRAEAVATARGQAVATVNRAGAERAVKVERASGESDAFQSLADARGGQALTDTRLYWDLIESAFRGKPKLVLDSSRSAPRHLIVPDFPAGLPAPALIGPPRPVKGAAP